MQEEFDNTAEKKENLDTQENIIEKNPTNKKTTTFNILLIVAIFIVLLIYMLKVDGIDNIIKILKTVDYKWVFLGGLCLLVHWSCEGLNLHIPIKRIYKDQKIFDSVKIAMIGQLFNNITPFSTGGQPMQAYELNKMGRRVSDSFSAMAMKFAITQTALVTTTIVIVLTEFGFVKELMGDYIWVAIVGVILNIIAIIAVILAGIKKEIITFIANSIINILAKIHVIKDKEKAKEKMNKSISNFRNQFVLMKSEKKMVLKMFIIAVIQSLAYYSITYMIYRAFGNYGINFFQIVPVQAFLLLIMTFIPTPGSGLGAEGGFYLLFNSIFKEDTINMSILFWRIYTFYLPILVGLIFLIPKRQNRD